MKLLTAEPHATLYIVRVNPNAPIWADDFHPNEPDWGTWLIDEGMLSTRSDALRKVVPVDTVRKSAMKWMANRRGDLYDDDTAELMADVYILGSLRHPLTPFGLGIRNNVVPGQLMHVTYHGECYTRSRRGVLTKTECLAGCGDSWPTYEHWAAMRRIVFGWAKWEGLLPS